jgi:hypothetical protein
MPLPFLLASRFAATIARRAARVTRDGVRIRAAPLAAVYAAIPCRCMIRGVQVCSAGKAGAAEAGAAKRGSVRSAAHHAIASPLAFDYFRLPFFAAIAAVCHIAARCARYYDAVATVAATF